jgi:hypothetical protein
MANLYDKAQYIYIAGANKSGSMYGIVPVAGTTNVTLATATTARLATGSRTNNNGIIEQVAPHILRVDYSDLVSCPSYKFEPVRTNYLVATDHLTSGSGVLWQMNFSSWSLVDDPTSPVGTGKTGLLFDDTTNDATGHYNRQATSLPTSGQRYVVSVYAKRAGTGIDTRNLLVQHAGVGSADTVMNTYFILEGTGSIYNPSLKSFVSGAYIEQLPNNWYRCSVLGSSAAATPTARFYLTSGSTHAIQYLGVGRTTAGLYLCGAQLESGSALLPRDVNTYNNISNWGTGVTAYISSSNTVAGTRNAADQTIFLPSSSNTTNWTAFMIYKSTMADPVINHTMFSVLSGSAGNYAGFYAGGRPIWVSGSANTTGVSGSQVFANIEHKIALRLTNGNQLTWFRDGERLFSPYTWPTTGTWGNFHIGSSNTSTEAITSGGSFFVRVAAMFNQGLTDAECLLLTATGSGTV